MSTGARLPLHEASRIADELAVLLHSVCDRIEIAGSIRRRQPTVGDVELVCIPTMITATREADLFGGASGYEVNLLDDLCQTMVYDGTLQYRLNKNGSKSWGPQLKWGTYRGFAVDIYSATPETWGVTMAIRTGSADFSHKLVTPRHQGGFCPSHLEFKGWRVRERKGGEPLETPEEADVFRVLGIEYLEPQVRDEKAYPMRLVAHG